MELISDLQLLSSSTSPSFSSTELPSLRQESGALHDQSSYPLPRSEDRSASLSYGRSSEDQAYWESGYPNSDGSQQISGYDLSSASQPSAYTWMDSSETGEQTVKIAGTMTTSATNYSSGRYADQEDQQRCCYSSAYEVPMPPLEDSQEAAQSSTDVESFGPTGSLTMNLPRNDNYPPITQSALPGPFTYTDPRSPPISYIMPVKSSFFDDAGGSWQSRGLDQGQQQQSCQSYAWSPGPNSLRYALEGDGSGYPQCLGGFSQPPPPPSQFYPRTGSLPSVRADYVEAATSQTPTSWTPPTSIGEISAYLKSTPRRDSSTPAQSLLPWLEVSERAVTQAASRPTRKRGRGAGGMASGISGKKTSISTTSRKKVQQDQRGMVMSPELHAVLMQMLPPVGVEDPAYWFSPRLGKFRSICVGGSDLNHAKVFGTPAIHLELKDSKLWNDLSSCQAEMITTNSGRRIFPTLSVNVKGLEPNRKYMFFMDMVMLEPHVLKHQAGTWMISGQAEVYPPSEGNAPLIYLQEDSPRCGSHWTEAGVNFMRAKITNSKDAGRHQNMIYVYSMHHYMPRYHIACELTKEEMERTKSSHFIHRCGWELVGSYVIPGTHFYSVTAYQNPDVIRVKIDNNPFAKGFRNRHDEFDFSQSPGHGS
ncbi:hypothetical protein AAHC03_020653 [Spirometra sp. Aus1]